MEPRTHYAQSSDVAIAYRVFGDGVFDVVYHPGVISHVELMTEMSTYQGHIVDGLASFSRVIAFDQRGVGMSDRINGTPGLETRMDDIRAARYMAERISGAKLIEAPADASFTQRVLDEAKQFLRRVWETDGLDEPDPDRVLATICSPTSSARPSTRRRWATATGTTCSIVITS